VLKHDQRAGGTFGALQCHASRLFSPESLALP
jgi:hypothetical protein